MTPEAQRITIAEACGWRLVKGEYGHSVLNQPNGETNCSDPDPQSNWSSFAYRLPDYLSDLNAMHEAEKAMSEFDFWAYTDHLREITETSTGEVMREFEFVHATAAQRVEAFLRTLNLWKD